MNKARWLLPIIPAGRLRQERVWQIRCYPRLHVEFEANLNYIVITKKEKKENKK